MSGRSTSRAVISSSIPSSLSPEPKITGNSFASSKPSFMSFTLRFLSFSSFSRSVSSAKARDSADASVSLPSSSVFIINTGEASCFSILLSISSGVSKERSILVTNMIVGTPFLLNIFHRVSPCGCMPSFALITNTAASITGTTLSDSDEKSTCPGVSRSVTSLFSET